MGLFIDHPLNDPTLSTHPLSRTFLPLLPRHGLPPPPSWGLGCRQRCGCIQQSGTWISAFIASSASSPVLHLEPPCIVSSQKPSTSSMADSLFPLLAPKVLGVKVYYQGKSSCLKPDVALGRRKICAKLNESQGPTDLLLQWASFQTCPWGLMSISIQPLREGKQVTLDLYTTAGNSFT